METRKKRSTKLKTENELLARDQPATETPRTERQTLGDLLREAIKSSGKSQREIERLAGIGIGQVSRFISSERDLTLETADKIAAVVGMSFAALDS